MTVNELLTKLQVPIAWVKEGSGVAMETPYGLEYKIELVNSDVFNNLYSRLDNADFLEVEDDKVIFTEHSSMIKYYADNLEVELAANFDSDTYVFNIYETTERTEDGETQETD